jgi:hypothetical protein
VKPLITMVTPKDAVPGRLRFLSVAFDALFDAHVFEFAGLEDFAALQAFHKFGIFFAAHNLHARMFARSMIGVWRLGERLCAHKSGSVALINLPRNRFAGISRYFSLALALVKYPANNFAIRAVYLATDGSWNPTKYIAKA